MFFVVDGKNVYPPLPPCKKCKKHKQYLICIALTSKASEYYVACEECGNADVIILPALWFVSKEEITEQWQTLLVHWESRMRKNESY